jgi:multimeric flavodoxin WrbA
MTKIVVINGSYRQSGITDQAVRTMANVLQSAGAEVDIILLREHPIRFCLNCRECTQQPGEQPERCIQHDGMEALIARIEQADAYVIASPTNFGSATAIFKRFMERLLVYAYWPWDSNVPRLRKADVKKKKAVLISSCAAPGILGRLLYGTHKQLKMTAKTIGAETAGSLFIGMISKDPGQLLSDKVQKRLEKLAVKLL